MAREAQIRNEGRFEDKNLADGFSSMRAMAEFPEGPVTVHITYPEGRPDHALTALESLGQPQSIERLRLEILATLMAEAGVPDAGAR